MVTEPSVARISVNPFMSPPACVFDVCVCLFGGKEGRRAPQVVQVRGRSLQGRSPGLYVRAFGCACGSNLFGVPLSASNGRYLFFFFFLLSRTTSDLLTFSALIVV